MDAAATTSLTRWQKARLAPWEVRWAARLFAACSVLSSAAVSANEIQPVM